LFDRVGAGASKCPAMPSMTPVDESFFATAPQRFVHTWAIDQPAEVVWSQLTGDQPLFWVKGLKINWTSAPPLGVGATREAHVLGLLTFQEHYFIWEEGRRKSFYVAGASLPLFKHVAEDYVIEPRGEKACDFTWTIAIEPSLLGKPGAPLNALIFGAAFRDTAKHFRAA
jgi:hypothetical protein